MTVNPNPYARRPAGRPAGSDGLADVLERILDKGLVIAGDIQINLLDIELITIKVRLLLASADTAQQMGIDWWKHDPFLTGKDRELAQENEVLRDRVDQLETAMGRKLATGEPSPGDVWGEGAQDQGARRGQRLPTGALAARRAAGSADGASDPDEGDGSAAREVEVDELVLQHESGGPGLRMTAAEESAGEEAEQHIEGVEELILERGSGGPELRVTAADLEAFAEQESETDEEASANDEAPSAQEASSDQETPPSSEDDGSAAREVEVDELVLQHESGGPGLRMTAAEESAGEEAEQHIEGVEELILERGSGGPELRVTAADLEAFAEQESETDEEASAEEQANGSDEDDEVYWLDEDTIEAMTRTDLQGELEARGLAKSGNKATLRERLLEALEDEWETVPDAESGEGSDADDD